MHVLGDDPLRVQARHPDVLADLLHDLVFESPEGDVFDAFRAQQLDLGVGIGRGVRCRRSCKPPDPANLGVLGAVLALDDPLMLVADLVGHFPAVGAGVTENSQLVHHDQVDVMPLGQIVGDDLHAVVVDDVEIETFVCQQLEALAPASMQYRIVEVRKVAEDLVPPGPFQRTERRDNQRPLDPFLLPQVVERPQRGDRLARAHIIQHERPWMDRQHVDGGALHRERLILPRPLVVILHRAGYVDTVVAEDQGLIQSMRDQGNRDTAPVHHFGVGNNLRDFARVL